ncbi:MAG: hypothetical protein NXI24_21095 [bacterium]|nr:hypothetical protein [bacterium]
MWLRVGDEELINLTQVTSIKKGVQSTIEIRYPDPKFHRTVRFTADEDRDAVFERIVDNMVRLRIAME